MKLLPIKPFTGSSWNVGELALVYAEITNTTGAPLKDIVVETTIWGSGAVFQPFYKWDGNGGYLGDLEPGETWKNYVALLKGTYATSFSLLLTLSAEVVPYATVTPTYATYAVQPAP